MQERSTPRGPLLGLGAVVVIAILLAILVRPAPEDVESLFGGGGVLGPALFVVAYVLLTIVVFPAAPLTIASGALYGIAAGAALSVLGAALGSAAAFLLARRATGEVALGGGGGRLGAIERRLSGRGLYALLMLRLVPVIPFNALNYAAAASAISTRDYLAATVLGIIPGALLYASIGAGLDNPASPLFIGAGVVAVGIALLVRRRSQSAVAEA